MELPEILWQRSARYERTRAFFRSGTRMEAQGGYINVDLEYPVASHIKMKTHEIHIGISLSNPEAGRQHNADEPIPVYVPEEEFQKARGEKNPIPKVRGDVDVTMTLAVGCGLGRLLSDFVSDQSARPHDPT